MKKIKYLYTILIVFILFSGCSEDILNLKNPNQYDTSTYFKTEGELLQATNAIYAGFYFGGMWVREYYFIYDLLGNDASVATALQGELAEFAKFSYNAAHGQINVYWRSLYRIVLRSNLVIDMGKEFLAKNPDNANVKRFIGEARFLRAWAYSELVIQFGRVPIKKTLQDLELIETPRSSTDEVWALISSDLDGAIEALPPSYGTSDLGRATKGAAIALKGKTLLYQKKYAEAADELALMEPLGYSLLPGAQWYDNWTDVDAKENNAESVFEVQIKKIPGANTWYMFGSQEITGVAGACHSGRPMEYGFNDWQNVYVSPAAVAAFKYKDESNNDYIDPRAQNTFYGGGGLGDSVWCDQCNLDTIKIAKADRDAYEWDNRIKTPLRYNLSKRGYRWKKYQNYEKLFKEGLPEASNNGKVIRYADVLLMRAEALIQSNRVTEGMALINIVRDRVGAFKYINTYAQAEALTLLKRERALELCGEQQRFRDLVRWGDAAKVLNQELNAQYSAPGTNNVYFQDKHVLFPIPQSEKDTNPAVKNDVTNAWN